MSDLKIQLSISRYDADFSKIIIKFYIYNTKASFLFSYPHPHISCRHLLNFPIFTILKANLRQSVFVMFANHARAI